MANYTALKAAIAGAIKTNGQEYITGQVLQEVLLSLVETIGESADNGVDGVQDAVDALSTALSNEINARSGGDNALQALINGIKANIDNGYVCAGIATTSTTPVSGKVFYFALDAGTYANFGGLVLTQGINTLKYDGSVWTSEQIIGIDNFPSTNSPGLPKSGGVDAVIKSISGYYVCSTAAATAAKTITGTNYVLREGGCIKVTFTYANTVDDATLKIGSADAKPLYYNGRRASRSNSWYAGETVEVYYDGTNYQALRTTDYTEGIFDISAYNATGGVAQEYAGFDAAVTEANVPASVRKGGMSVKFIQSSDNKYVQYRLMSDTFNTTVANWQGVDDEPTTGSDNLVKSGGVVKHLTDNLGYTANPEDWELVGNCSISSAGNWDVGDTYESKSFDITELRGVKLTVKANNIGNAIISFVKTIGYPSNPVFATGETGRHLIPVSTSDELIVPVDANYAVVTTKNNNQDRTPQIYGEFAKFDVIEHAVDNPDSEPIVGSGNLITSDGVTKLINDAAGNNVNNKTWSAGKLFSANQMLNMLSTAFANEIGNYREYDGKYFDTAGNVNEDVDFKIVTFCCLKQDTTLSIVNSSRRNVRVFILNAFTGITAISVSADLLQTIPLDSYNSDYTNNIVLVSLEKTSTMSVDGIVPTANIALDNISDTIYRTTLRTIMGKAMNPTTGEIFDATDFTLNYFSTDSDTFAISFSNVQSGRAIRVFAFKNGVFLGQIHRVEPTTAVDIDIEFPHYGTLFVVQCHKNNVFTISNLVTEDGVVESVRKLLANSNNQTYLIDTYLNKGRVEYSAHRGLRTVAPENSIPAYEAAGRAGFDFLNLAQLRQSADGTWYVMHDDTIDRTTDGTGQIKHLTDAYLQTVHIDVGPNVEQYTPEELVIPTLEKAIQIARKYGMKLYFRIASITGNSYQADKAAWDSFIAIIRKYRCEGMLFGGNRLTDLLPLHRDLGLDWCINYDVYSSEAIYQQIADYVNNGIKNATIFAEGQYITDAHIAAAREHGFKVMVHLPDNTTKAQCLEWSNKGVDIIGGVVNYDLSED